MQHIIGQGFQGSHDKIVQELKSDKILVPGKSVFGISDN